MRVVKSQQWSLFVYSISVLALIFYLYGFFPMEYSTNLRFNRSSAVQVNSSEPRFVDKLAIIIIDALRSDFVKSNNGYNYMPFTFHSILNNESCFMNTKAHSPTVTMPRIKAITSGTVSSYVDIIFNFMSSDFKKDNFINIAASRGLKLIFYGDDTWLKLFPKAFTRSEGTNSFFTLDYTEVDRNVSRHIDDEFKKSDWDMIILHYLGLDHIGHTEGPYSPLVKPKLQEMDSIIKKFSDYFKALEEKKSLKTMLIVTSDHGMKDSGSHGGMSHPEVMVPLISVGKPCQILSGWPKEYTPLQIDLAPTISVLLGIPMPFNNLGKIIPALLHGLPRHKVLKYLEMNRLEFSKFKCSLNNDPDMEMLGRQLNEWMTSTNKNEKVLEHITENYFHYLSHISEEIVNSKSDFKLLYLIVPVVLMWIFLTNLLYNLLILVQKPQNLICWFLIFGTVSHAVSFTSTSFIEEEHQTWYFLWVTYCVLTCLTLLSNNAISSYFQKIKTVLPWVAISLSHRFFRRLNQTGDKWAFLPDVKSYLNSEEGQICLFPLFIFGIGMIFCCAVKEGCSKHQLITYGISLLAVVSYRISCGSFHSNLEFFSLFRTISEVHIFWIFMGLFIFQTAQTRSPMYLVWLLLTSLLLRPHNIILPPMEVFISKQIHKIFYKSEDIAWNCVAHAWLGNLFYFYQGNGNSLANIDVASGFVGIQTYNPVYAGIMMAAHTSNAHILSFILSEKSNLIYAVVRLIPLALYCTILLSQLNHLFIWSVFSPKLLYETNTTLIYLMLMLIGNFFSKKFCIQI